MGPNNMKREEPRDKAHMRMKAVKARQANHSPQAHFCDRGKDGAAGMGAAFCEQTWVLL